ncbi:MAG: GTPase [Thermogutta sp.]
MKIGLVGYQGCGKSTLFEWLTRVAPDPALAYVGQSAMAVVPAPRLAELQRIYNAKKVTPAALEIVDTPGLNRSHQGNAGKLAILRDTGCLVIVVPAFSGYDPQAELRLFQEDLIIADLEIVAGRIERVEASLKRPHPKPEREQLEEELQVLQAVKKCLEAGNPLRESEMTPEQLKHTRSFRLLCEKPQIVVINTADDERDFQRF